MISAPEKKSSDVPRTALGATIGAVSEAARSVLKRQGKKR